MDTRTRLDAIQVGGTRVEYRDQGSGELVLLLHSSGSSNAQWHALIDRLSADFRVIAPDLLGYGGTGPWTGRGAFELAHEAQIAHALIGRVGEPAHVVGHSYGGAVALHFARLRSDLLRSLTLIEPVAFHLLHGDDDADTLALREISRVAAMTGRALACGDYQGGFGRFVDYWSGPGAWDRVPGDKRGAAAARLAKVALDFHATLNEPARPDDLRMMALPTLVVQGDASPLPTRRICGLLARALPQMRMATIAGAGHLAPMTHRDEVNDLIVAHLDANRVPRRASASALEVA